MEATTHDDGSAIFSKHRSRLRYYDTVGATSDEGHPVESIVQRWPSRPGAAATLKLQDRIMAALAPDARRAFLELEELRNKVAAGREEAFYRT